MKTIPNPTYVRAARAASGQLRYVARPALRKLYRDGASLEECADAANTSVNWVWRALKEAGEPLRNQGARKKRLAKLLPV